LEEGERTKKEKEDCQSKVSANRRQVRTTPSTSRQGAPSRGKKSREHLLKKKEKDWKEEKPYEKKHNTDQGGASPGGKPSGGKGIHRQGNQSKATSWLVMVGVRLKRILHGFWGWERKKTRIKCNSKMHHEKKSARRQGEGTWATEERIKTKQKRLTILQKEIMPNERKSSEGGPKEKCSSLGEEKRSFKKKGMN